MSEKKILLTNDLCFKKIFASDQNKDILKGLIRDVFDINVLDVVIKQPYSIKEFNRLLKKKGHYAVEVDTLCITEKNWNFHLEMQLWPQNFYLRRALYYLCSTYQSNYGQDDLMALDNKYSALSPTFSINILGFEQFKKDDEAVHIFHFKDEHNEKLSEPDLLTLCFFELRKPQIKRENLKYWQQLFLTGQADPCAPEYIRHAVDLLKLSNFSKEERKMIDALEKATQDRIAWEEYVLLKAKSMTDEAKEKLRVGVEELRVGAEELRVGTEELRVGTEELRVRTEELCVGWEKLRAAEQEARVAEQEIKLESAVNMIRELHLTVTKTMEILKMPEDLREQLVAELEKQEICYK